MVIVATTPNSIPRTNAPPVIGLTILIAGSLIGLLVLVTVLVMGESVSSITFKQAFIVAMLTFVGQSLFNDKAFPATIRAGVFWDNIQV